jgi:hypothetical protein
MPSRFPEAKVRGIGPDDEGGNLEIGGEVAGSRVVSDESARFIEEGGEGFKRFAKGLSMMG